MDWLDNLFKKLPTLKGITYFFYVASHWGTFKEELAQYRQQIQDRENWLKVQESNLKKIHDHEIKKLIDDYEDKLQHTTEAFGTHVDLFQHSVTLLAVHYRFEPLLWQAMRNNLPAGLAKMIETVIEKIPLPPPQPTFPTFGSILLQDSVKITDTVKVDVIRSSGNPTKKP